jgi:hypothetical protein
MSVGMSRRVFATVSAGFLLNGQRKQNAGINSCVTAVWLFAVSAAPDGLVGRMNETGQDAFPLASTRCRPHVIHCSLPYRLYRRNRTELTFHPTSVGFYLL